MSHNLPTLPDNQRWAIKREYGYTVLHLQEQRKFFFFTRWASIGRCHITSTADSLEWEAREAIKKSRQNPKVERNALSERTRRRQQNIADKFPTGPVVE